MSKQIHGMTNSDEHRIWCGMLNRCGHFNYLGSEIYISRGISVCDEWRNDFMNFYRDMGKRPSKKHSIERIDNNLGYSPNNCRWATYREQQNNKRNTVLVDYLGEIRPLSMWCSALGIDRHHAWGRLKRGEKFDYIVATAKPRSPMDVCVNGVSKKITDWADIVGVTRTSAYRLHRSGGLIKKILESSFWTNV